MYDAIVVGARVAGAPTALLLARAGHRVLLVDRDPFPSDTMSTHYIHQPGVACLKRWGLLDRIVASGCPPITWWRFNLGPLVLQGWGPSIDGIAEAYAPRRTVLDTILVEAAAAAGVEVRTGFSVQDLTWDDDRVTGIRGRSRDGSTVTEQTHVVVGADGIHSTVARAVNAPRYHEKPPLACYYYAYWRDARVPYIEAGAGDGCFYVIIPTNDDQVVVAVGRKHAQFHAYRADVEGTYFATLAAMAPELGARLEAGTRVSRYVGTADLPNFYRRPYGPGWALVGDAGYHKDPYTGYGITDAFRDAESLAAALDAGFSERQPMADALASYQRTRDAITLPLYEFICQLAALDPPPAEMQALFGALAGNPEALSQFIGVIDGTVAVPEFFAPDNLDRIMATAGARAALA
jgi:2-polyprenyl-6-methoxyphenol hydroxylase-like FAD-dependent oxidoreductase